MGHTKVNFRDVEPVAGRLHFLRDPLGCESLGLSVRELAPGESGKEHDHAHDGQEEVYLLIEGEATLVVDDDERLDLRPGDAVRVDPDSTRHLRNGDVESLLVIAGSP